MNVKLDFDVIVIGAGHAGIEASLAPARLGLRTALITSNASRVGFMSCNPAIGGLAKGHMVREIDVLGGEMGKTTDLATIQFRRLNMKKGPAVRGSRSQCDKDIYSEIMGKVVRTQPNLSLIESEVKSLKLNKNKCEGVVLADGSEMSAQCAIVTTGTFMRGVLHFGMEQKPGGRVGDSATAGLSDQLRGAGFSILRLKTGTPARLDGTTIDWSKMEAQPGDQKFYPFSFLSPSKYILPQVSCYLSYTNEKTHDLIRKNLDKSPMYSGIIEGVGPRYCPSIEDKVVRFADKSRHQTFLEPEGLSTNSVYLQGMSTSLPAETQDEFIRTISGLENAKILRHGYAVEYDSVEPTQLRSTLETHLIENLFLAGQINGTSGYEEAAAQGLVAGINVSNKILGRAPLVMRRDQSYSGVMIDDLVTKGAKEPYRMFTSRAEHRLVLREDNTLERLAGAARAVGLHKAGALEELNRQVLHRTELLSQLKLFRLFPTRDMVIQCEQIGIGVVINPLNGDELLRRPSVSFDHLKQVGFSHEYSVDVEESVEIECKYSGYVKKQLEMIAQISKMESLPLPEGLDFKRIRGLSVEEVEKLSSVRPFNVGQASRISGVNPSAIQAIVIYLKGGHHLAGANA